MTTQIITESILTCLIISLNINVCYISYLCSLNLSKQIVKLYKQPNNQPIFCNILRLLRPNIGHIDCKLTVPLRGVTGRLW